MVSWRLRCPQTLSYNPGGHCTLPVLPHVSWKSLRTLETRGYLQAAFSTGLFLRGQARELS